MSSLNELYANNFLVYYKAHSLHFNIMGPTFLQDHMLLQEVYEALFEQHDILGELLRQTGSGVAPTLKKVFDDSTIDEGYPKTRDGGLKAVNSGITRLIECGQECYDKNDDGAVQTVVGDYLVVLNKLHWKILSSVATGVQ